MTQSPRRDIGWVRAGATGLAIVAYFAVTTVWLPDWLLRWQPVVDASDLTQDVVAVGVWLVATALGLWVLRVAQRGGRI